MKNRIFTSLITVFIGFVAIIALLLLERIGILYGETEKNVDILPQDQITHLKDMGELNKNLLVVDSGNEISVTAKEVYDQIFIDMRIPTDVFDIAVDDTEDFGQLLENYKTVVFCICDYDAFENNIFYISRWVAGGGRAMIGMPPEGTDTFMVISPMMGILSMEGEFGDVSDFVSDSDFMIGSQETYVIDDSFESSIIVALDSKCKVYARTSDDRIPLVWSRDYRDGRFVFCNFGYTEKSFRGIYSSAFTLLDDVCVYPVINASTFYLDDFPSPVPSGNGEYIKRDYAMDTADFYSSVWWPDLLVLGEKHNVSYTGLIIETYEDDTSDNIVRNGNTADYYYYGNMLLNRGGELGYHGYNHQPLCLSDFEFKQELGYRTWESSSAMKDAYQELINFSTGIFPGAELSVYVPPSDILSRQGREMIGKDFPEIRAIASIYLTGPDEYSQEYTVAQDGVVETPRIISGGVIDDYMQSVAFSELNFHYVGSHFMHPDDLLDEDRGAELGWECLREGVDGYMTWMDVSAPDIRHVTGSGMAGAVQRFTNVVPEYSYDDTSITLDVDGLIDSAYFFVRVNEGEIGEVSGGELTQLNGTLYLLEAKSPKIVMTRK